MQYICNTDIQFEIWSLGDFHTQLFRCLHFSCCYFQFSGASQSLNFRVPLFQYIHPFVISSNTMSTVCFLQTSSRRHLMAISNLGPKLNSTFHSLFPSLLLHNFPHFKPQTFMSYHVTNPRKNPAGHTFKTPESDHLLTLLPALPHHSHQPVTTCGWHYCKRLFKACPYFYFFQSVSSTGKLLSRTHPEVEYFQNQFLSKTAVLRFFCDIRKLLEMALLKKFPTEVP